MKRMKTKVVAMLLGCLLRSDAPMPKIRPQRRRRDRQGLEFLKTQQKPDHSWQRDSDPPAVTAIVLKAFLGDRKYDADQPFLDKGYDALLAFQKPNGGIYKDMLANYNTAIAISTLAIAKEAEYQEPQNKAVAFLKRLQWSDDSSDTAERKSVDDKNPNFGGWGYGKKERADGSNLQFALDALHDAGLKPDDPAFQRAVKFVTRMQNHSETNDQPWAGNDGGFIYTPADGGNSPAGEYTGADGKRFLRSYGSMTYGGLKSLIYAGLTKDDSRVKAAWDWISKNWTLDENPGFREADPATAASGMFYYYHTLARCLNAYDEPTIVDSKGTKHDWRVELIAKLGAIQKPDGSWVGEKRWMEDSPVLATAYSVIALEEAKQDLAEHAAK